MADDESMTLTGFFFGKVDERGWLEYDDNGQVHQHGLCLIPCVWVPVVDWYTCAEQETSSTSSSWQLLRKQARFPRRPFVWIRGMRTTINRRKWQPRRE
jgi:hypothetical protein